LILKTGFGNAAIRSAATQVCRRSSDKLLFFSTSVNHGLVNCFWKNLEARCLSFNVSGARTSVKSFSPFGFYLPRLALIINLFQGDDCEGIRIGKRQK